MSNVERRINGYMNEEDSSSRALGIGNLTLLVNIVAPPRRVTYNCSNSPIVPILQCAIFLNSKAPLNQLLHCFIVPFLNFTIALFPHCYIDLLLQLLQVRQLLQLLQLLHCSNCLNGSNAP